MPNSPSLLVTLVVIQLVLIAALVAQWRHGRRTRASFTRQCVGANERTGALVHALNQPLTAILSNAQAAQRFLASDRLDVQELRDILEDIVTDDKRAAGIVRSIGGIMEAPAASRLAQGSAQSPGSTHGPGGNSAVRKEREP